jgi:hypothetical protein
VRNVICQGRIRLDPDMNIKAFDTMGGNEGTNDHVLRKEPEEKRRN